MNRRTLLFPRSVCWTTRLFFTPTVPRPSETTTAAAPPSHGGGRLLFPDDAQFWFETGRSAFGAAEYGGSAVRRGPRHRHPASRPVTMIAGTPNGMRRRIVSQPRRPINPCARPSPSAHATVFCARRRITRSSEFFLHGQPGDPRIMRPTSSRSIATSRPRSCMIRLIEGGRDPYEHTTLPGYLPSRRQAGPAADPDHAYRLRRIGRGDACVGRARRGRARLQRAGVRRAGPVRAAAPRRPGLPCRLGEGDNAGRSTSH